MVNQLWGFKHFLPTINNSDNHNIYCFVHNPAVKDLISSGLCNLLISQTQIAPASCLFILGPSMCYYSDQNMQVTSKEV